MADLFGDVEPITQVLMAFMGWATRLLQLAAQDKAAQGSDRRLCNRPLEVGIASNRRSDKLR